MMSHSLEWIILLAGFLLVTLGSARIGTVFARFGLPKITGYLFTGLLAGPFVLNMIPHEAPPRLLFVDEFSLAFIAFAAGSELYLPEVRGQLRSIGLVTAGLVLFTLTFSLAAILFLADQIPFIQQMDTTGRLAVALLVGAILVARSPSSAIAVVNELRAKGPFTQLALGVTILTDVAVIVLFAIGSSAADAMLTGVAISPVFALLLVMDLSLAVAAGYALYRLLDWGLSLSLPHRLKIALLLLTGYGVFLLAGALRTYTHAAWPFEVLIEPLLVCLIASFLLNNYSPYRLEMAEILHETGPFIYILFFTLTGASLEVDLLLQTWPIALALFFVRLAAIMAGSFLSGVVAGDSMAHNRLKWMVLITQAGVALGLAKEVAVEFPSLGSEFATLIISVVVINETVGPLFFKRAIKQVGEAHTRGKGAEFDGVRDALIFGRGGQALVLARRLEQHGWQVKRVCPEEEAIPYPSDNGMPVHTIPEVNLPALQSLQADKADAIIAMLSDAENHRLCQLAYEHFGTELLVALVEDRANATPLRELGVLVVDPRIAIASLLDHVVRAPAATSIFLGLDEEQDVLDVELRDPALAGIPLRTLRLPLDTLILSIHRQGQLIVPHGHTQLQLGDCITLLGPPDKLETVATRFEVGST